MQIWPNCNAHVIVSVHPWNMAASPTPITVAYGDGIGPEIMAATLEILKAGVDVYVEWPSKNATELAGLVGQASGEGRALELIANRGMKVWPDGSPDTFRTDSFRCRFMRTPGNPTMPKQVIALLDRVVGLGLEIAITENLRNYDGKPGFTLAQGQ
jgi:isocitrate dehydrogenase